MAKTWNVLIVDDEEDVHVVTKMALRRRQWRGRSFSFTSAKSGVEARKILSEAGTDTLHAAIVDVVMESEHAGLELCEYIRETMPLSVRIILRTGQPGKAPEEKVLNYYDIDHYLAKAEVTEERLYTALRACCRSSLDIASLLVLESQLRDLTLALQSPHTTVADLVRIMYSGLRFLEDKHDVRLVFADNLEQLTTGPAAAQVAEAAARASLDLEQLRTALLKAHEGEESVRNGVEVGLTDCDLVCSIRALDDVGPRRSSESRGDSTLSRMARIVFGSRKTAGAENVNPVRGGMVARAETAIERKEKNDITRDLRAFAQNWRLALALLNLREVTVHERIVALESATHGGAG